MLATGALGLTGNELKVNVDGTTTTIVANQIVSNPPVTINNVLFVSKNGNNATAAVGNMRLPYLTIAGAMAAATASVGQTIMVFPGTYTETASITMKNDVNIELVGAGVLNTAGTQMFTDAATNVHVKILGPGWDFISEDGGAGSKKFMAITGASEIFIHLRELETTSATHITVNNASAEVVVHADMLCATTAFSVIQMDAGTIHLNFRLMENPGGIGCWAQNGGSMHGTAEEMNCFNSCVLSDSAFGTDRFDWVVKKMTSVDDWPFWITGDSDVRGSLYCEYMETSSDCGVVATGTGCTVNAHVLQLHMTRDVVSVGDIDGAIHGEAGGIVYFTGRITRDALAINGYDIKTSGGGSVYLKDASYDVTRMDDPNVFVWNGTSYVPAITNQGNVDNSGNVVTNSDLQGVTINWATFTGCTVSGATIKDRTITFTGNNQTYYGDCKLQLTVSQTGATDPTIDATIINTTPATISGVSRVSDGYYFINFDVAILHIGKFDVRFGNIVDAWHIIGQRNSGTQLLLHTWNIPSAAKLDDGMNGTTVTLDIVDLIV